MSFALPSVPIGLPDDLSIGLFAKITISGIFFHRTPMRRPTVCVTCVWVGVDSVWEQEKLEARKRLVNRADSHLSGARFVSRVFVSINYYAQSCLLE